MNNIPPPNAQDFSLPSFRITRSQAFYDIDAFLLQQKKDPTASKVNEYAPTKIKEKK